jgi:hypothetical protein
MKDESFIGVAMLFGISLAVSVLTHALVRKYLRACFYAACASTFAFSTAAFLHDRPLNPLFPVAIVTGFLITLAVAVVTGIPFKIARWGPPDSD